MSAFSGVVTRLSTTPLKGTRLHAPAEIELSRLGVPDDRRFYLVDERGRLFNGKRSAALTTVLADYDSAREELRLNFRDGLAVSDQVHEGPTIETTLYSEPRPAIVVSNLLSEALSEQLGQAVRLVRAAPGSTGIDRGASGGVSLISSGSLQHLAGVAGREVEAGRFRMLIEVEGPPAHGEDLLVGRRARVGGALVQFHGHVGRCRVTTLNPLTGESDVPTLELLGYRKGLDTTEPLAFGIYGEVIEPGKVRLGDKVESAA
jgi:uncharacterized protein YcbX